MACILCNVDKLSNEFPSKNCTEECDHPSLICLRCLLQHVDKHGKCPFPECSAQVPKESPTIQLFRAILSKQFKEYESAYTPLLEIGGGNQYINVTGLTGESASIPFSPSMTVDQLKTQIQNKLKHEKGKQKLLYEGKEMAVIGPNGGNAIMSDYGVKPNSTVCLVICLFSIPDNFDDVVFDLFWGYPHNRTDFLDASCLMFKGSIFDSVIDWSHKQSFAIRHSGDVMDNIRKIGHHTINVSLKKIPSNITHLFFTLSAWSSPNIAYYPNPSLKFYDASRPGKDLCKTSFNHARNSQAVVMCSVSRNPAGNWQIFESGQLSSGNASNYQQIIKTIQQLIARGV